MLQYVLKISPIWLKGPRQRKRKGREREGGKLPKSWSVKAKPSTALSIAQVHQRPRSVVFQRF